MAERLITILDNVRWSESSPKLYLTLTYKANVNPDGTHTNRDYGAGTYTFRELTLTVSNPQNSSFGYTIGAKISSGSQSTNQVQVKGSTPTYWKTQSFNFGDFVVSGIQIGSNSVPITLNMFSSMKKLVTTQTTTTTSVGYSKTDPHLTDLAVGILKSNYMLYEQSYYWRHELYQWSQCNLKLFSLGSFSSKFTFGNQYQTTHISGIPLNEVVSFEALIPLKGGEWKSEKLNLQNVRKYNTRMTSELYVTTKKEVATQQTNTRTYETILNFDGFLYECGVNIGSEYDLPDSIVVYLPKMGKDFVYYDAIIGDCYPNPDWQYCIALKDSDGKTKAYVIADDEYDEDSGTVPKEYFSLFDSNSDFNGQGDKLQMSPGQKYVIQAWYGEITGYDVENGEPIGNTDLIVGSGNVTVPTRFGFYVYMNEELGWQWAIPYVYENGWKECVPAIYNNNEWNTSAENKVSNGGES